MISWTQTDRFETVMTAAYRGMHLRIVGWVNCSDNQATARAFARPAHSGDEVESKVVEDIKMQSLDEAVRVACEAAMSYADAFVAANPGLPGVALRHISGHPGQLN